MLIREESLSDHAAVAEVQRQAFADATDAASYVDDLRASFADHPGLSLVAIEQDAVVGHALFTSNLLDAPRQLVGVQVLSPLGVLPRSQGIGIGGALVKFGLDELSRRGVPMVVLEGSPEYYVRFGFMPGHKFGLRRPSLRIPEDAFQVKLLAAYESWMTGTLVYRQTFWDHDAVGLRDSQEAD